jgi:hypothetical protein
MAVGQGFSKVVTSGSIFHYDTGDMINSFKGKPGTNSLDGVIKNYDGYSLTTYSNGKLFETNGYTETVNIPALGNRTVQSIEIYNVYSGYGTDGNFNCCPNLFRYSLTGWNGTQLSGSTLYMYEIIYKCESGYTNPNYMYHYETRADSTYNTEFGVHDDSRRISLGDGWYYAWGDFTTQATTAQGYFGLWYYSYNTRDKVSIASISLQQGNSVLPPRQFIPGATTRSTTQALLDLTGNSTLDPKLQIEEFQGKKIIRALQAFTAWKMPSYRVKYQSRDFLEYYEMLTIETSRGCKFKCDFCNFPILGVKEDVSRSAQDLKEIEHH